MVGGGSECRLQQARKASKLQVCSSSLLPGLVGVGGSVTNQSA